ncbi:MAG: hypothetical protein KBA71_04225 [Opitutaceae bacterium]|nr:hypothetical protein [Opitutaceae bacterium]
MTLPAPVLFVPGIMGSTLRDEYPVDPENVWSVLKAATKNYDRITLHPDDVRYELVEPARVARDQVFQLFYGEIIEELRHNLTQDPASPVPVYPFAYDWRQPLDIIEGELAAFVGEVIARTSLMRHYHADGFSTRTGKVNIVAHSMGGLITAGYLARAGFKSVDRVASLASPFRGSLESIAKVAIGVGGFSLSGGGSREREAARLTPSLYHLLPSYDEAVTAEGGLTEDIFLPEAWQPGILETLATFVTRYGLRPDDPRMKADRLLAAMLDRAWRHRRRLERLKLPDPRRWLCVVGVDAETRVSMAIRPDGGGKPRFELEDPRNEWGGINRLNTGDNTVPYLGARCAFVPVEQVVCVTPGDFGFFEFGDQLLAKLGFHSALPSMNLVQRLVTSHLLGRPQGKLGGRPPPEIDPADWDPPISELLPR